MIAVTQQTTAATATASQSFTAPLQANVNPLDPPSNPEPTDTVSLGQPAVSVTGAASTVGSLFGNLLGPGKYDLPAPALPAYPQLNSQLVQHAMEPNVTISTPAMKDAGGGVHEPTTVRWSGSLATLKAALQKEGWGPATLVPMSPMYVNGHAPVLSLQKNAQLEGMSRDHVRVFQVAPNTYDIHATRDTNPFMRVSSNGTETYGHETDPQIDGERNLVVSDLLKAMPSVASTLHFVHGVPTATAPSNYVTNGYVAELGTP
ncbi:MAG TPA: LssY C-terminal domain-containing protein [Candidatus Xenobia bacterium]|jgi:hypothetical protein